MIVSSNYYDFLNKCKMVVQLSEKDGSPIGSIEADDVRLQFNGTKEVDILIEKLEHLRQKMHDRWAENK